MASGRSATQVLGAGVVLSSAALEDHDQTTDGRAAAARIERDARALKDSPVIRALLECVNGALLVLNESRQIVAAAGLERIGLDERAAASLLGERPGEALGCPHAQKGTGGCGTSAACRGCGALGAIVGCQASGRPVERELLTTVQGAEGRRVLELSVRATPVTAAGECWTALAMRDISAEKRRESLERIFLHDLLNTFSGLTGWTHLLQRAGPGDWRRISERVNRVVQQMDCELREQRALLDAEDGSLQPQSVEVQLPALLEELATTLASSPVANGRTVIVGPRRPEGTATGSPRALLSDPTLLRRVLLNMLKNALEAAPPGGTVHIWGAPEPGGLGIHVWNSGAIPATVAERIFQRSFSTKAGRGRGLGTYGMRLLGERYLGGTVSFTSTPENGTTFTLRLPSGPP